MPKITALEEVGDDKRRRRVVFADGRTVELPLEVVVAAGMLPGRTVRAGDVHRAVRQDELRSAERDGLRLLRVRDRSESELRRELGRKGYCPETVEAVLKKCRGWGYLDDRRLAERLVSDGIEQKHLGPARVRQRLRQRGIDEETARKVREKAEEAQPDLVERALCALRPKMKSYARLEPEVAKRRMMAFLQRRGFGFQTIREAMERVGRSAGDEGKLPEE